MAGQGRGMARGGIARGFVAGGPGIAGGDINGGVRPSAPAGAGQLGAVKAVQLHQVARGLCLDVADRLWALGPRLGRDSIAGNGPQPLGAGMAAGAAQHVPDAVRAALMPTPPWAPQPASAGDTHGCPQKAARG